MPLQMDERSKRAIDEAKTASVKAGHFYIGVEHLMLSIMDTDSASRSALTGMGADPALLREKITELATPGDRENNFYESPRYKRVLKNAEKTALDARAYRIEPLHILLTLLEEKKGIPILALEQAGLDPALIEKGIHAAIAGGALPDASKPGGAAGAGSAAAGSQAQQPGANRDKKEPKLLAQFSRDLVELAKSGTMDPVVGRNDEIRRVLQTLSRKGKNNPILVGEAGVGKTAVVYGLAQRIAEGNVPDMLKSKRILDLSLAAIVAGAKHRGEFEERLQAIIKEVHENPDIVLFIDEIHTIVGAGDSKGGMDAGNILKPMLARGEFPVIGATTIDEFRKSLEQDPALERRFQQVLVGEPSEEDTLAIIKGLQERYEKHHGVKFTDKALLASVKLSVRYLPDRNLPDKAIDLLDEAAAKVKMRSVSMSQGDCPPSFDVTDETIAEIISLWTGIPVSKLTSEEKERLLNMEDYLQKRVIGQEEAIKVVSQTIRMVRMGLGSPNRPGGIFLFLGPTGVGKTELAKTLADFLFGSEREMIRLDMSEFMEKHTISRLIGSPPGYVGHEEEGQLTKQVRTKPYSVVLLDEIEKAHPEVFDLFLQVFDEGRLTDSKGRTVNFTNTMIILTSNIGTSKVDADGNTVLIDTKNPEVREQVFKELRKSFRPEFLNRIDEIILFNPLGRESLHRIISLSMADILKRVMEKGITLELEESAADLFLSMGYNPAYGARPLKRAIQTYLSKPMAETMLSLGEGFTGKIIVKAHPAEERLVFEEVPDRPSSPSARDLGAGGTIIGNQDREGGQNPRRTDETMIGGPHESQD